jgi:hypothetical protein
MAQFVQVGDCNLTSRSEVEFHDIQAGGPIG